VKLPSFQARPSRESLYTSPLHVIARDFPETLEEFRAHGVSLEEYGDRTLQEFENAAAILDDLEASTAWRPKIGEA
jgi:hypothetical protein